MAQVDAHQMPPNFGGLKYTKDFKPHSDSKDSTASAPASIGTNDYGIDEYGPELKTVTENTEPEPTDFNF